MNNEQHINQVDAAYTFATGGEKSITLTASIPGCESSKTDQLHIIPGPATSFRFEGSCEYDLFRFTNQTTGDGISGYQWDFGDGYTSSVSAPSHRFGTANNYIVSLTASNTSGCQTTLNQVVPVHAKPQLNFTHDLACAGSEITFYDQSVATGANIVDRYWQLSNPDLDYSRTAAGAEPAFLAHDAGTFSMQLVGITNFGCSDTLERAVNIKASPKADFILESTCLGDSTLFRQAVDLPAGSQLLSVDWIIDGRLQSGTNAKYLFPSDGLKQVEMFVRADNLCTGHLYKNIFIQPLPTADIRLSAQCAGQPAIISAVANTSSSYPIAQYSWMIDGKIVSTQQDFIYTFKSRSEYELSLMVKTDNNCQNAISEVFSVYPTPRSEFELSPSIGAAPLSVQFTDRSAESDQVTYYFSKSNDDKSTLPDPSYTYTSLGYDYPYQVAENEYGCRDTSYATLQVVVPVYDLAIRDVKTETNNDKLRIFVTLANEGTIIINNPVVRIDLDKSISLEQKLECRLLPGESREFEIDFEVLKQSSSVGYICLSINKTWAGYDDANTENNAQCVSLKDTYKVLEPYPNPSNSYVDIPVIMPNQGQCAVSLFNSNGDLVSGKKFNDLQRGLNILRVEVGLLSQGVYLVNIRHQDLNATKKIMVN